MFPDLKAAYFRLYCLPLDQIDTQAHSSANQGATL